MRLASTIGSYSLALTILQACASATPSPDSYKTILVPAGWVADFSYAEPLEVYLRKQAAVARARGKEPIIYVFDDVRGSCKRFRRHASIGELSTLFENKHVVMINRRYIHQVVGRDENVEVSPLNKMGTFIPIDRNGDIIGPAITGFTDMVCSRTAQHHILKVAFDRIYVLDQNR